MKEPYNVNSYWGPRRETAEECARRLKALVDTLARRDPAFEKWFRLGRSRKEALSRPLSLALPDLEHWVRRNKDKVFEDLGFRMGAWNGLESRDSAGLSVKCGCTFENVSNVCNL